ncbi:L-rhamnose mutarotase [Saccharicrinis sp. FJH62]|uniref:L-rhamnose mutarotase n=1 Tax=Saccharicrinis sp. FJH62 TaxID=3344657 RepID=UPI0035D45AB2
MFLLLLLLMVACRNSGNKASEKGNGESDQYRMAVEVVLKDEADMNRFLSQFAEIKLEKFAWKNHVVLFGDKSDTAGIGKKIRTSDIPYEIKWYLHPFYVFDKLSCCADTAVSSSWNDYVLTANLVEDTVLQNEYMAYHKTQFTKWPEVAQGFCHAGFQQLLVFRSGRQLLLVISVPSDKTLDELDPKTVENNPRMVEWNNLMSRYQEGIEGTSDDETWVFLDKVSTEKELKR